MSRRERTHDPVEHERASTANLGGLFAMPTEPQVRYAVGDPRWLPETPIEHDFADFHRKNPHVYAALERLARQRYEEGRRRIAISKLFEDLRDATELHTDGHNWKVNNSHRSLYARMLAHLNPELASLIKTRERTERGAA